ncbi:hypothetical protein HF1_09120 [Mycoplasma haemofelis str. Langford 1]|uniref:Lipoprotein n=1 Tax=Mycoplasma haemofelis (strain Langford 1) TaxID=941640 RepID=E8ZIE9_MYCHL|nr:hypothetical protein [Mycoplasma haemofelis]CBY92920.1 hypothetical protein HF1_09120 [Mycoplasma haemofelis str. Langford 1]
MTKPQIAMASSAGACGVAGIGCGVYFLSENLNSYIDTTTLSPESKTIKSHLQGDGFSVLDVNGDSNHWTTLKDKYKQLNGKLGKGAEGDSDIDEAKLKELCKEALEQEYAEGSTYDQTIKWCVVPTSVTDHLKRKGFTLVTAELLQNQKHKWMVDTYDNGHYKINGVESINKTASTLVTKCDEKGKKNNYEEGFYNDLVSIRQWCFIQYP